VLLTSGLRADALPLPFSSLPPGSDFEVLEFSWSSGTDLLDAFPPPLQSWAAGFVNRHMFGTPVETEPAGAQLHRIVAAAVADCASHSCAPGETLRVYILLRAHAHGSEESGAEVPEPATFGGIAGGLLMIYLVRRWGFLREGLTGVRHQDRSPGRA
jgi:hypothetical protein